MLPSAANPPLCTVVASTTRPPDDDQPVSPDSNPFWNGITVPGVVAVAGAESPEALPAASRARTAYWYVVAGAAVVSEKVVCVGPAEPIDGAVARDVVAGHAAGVARGRPGYADEFGPSAVATTDAGTVGAVVSTVHVAHRGRGIRARGGGRGDRERMAAVGEPGVGDRARARRGRGAVERAGERRGRRSSSGR